MSDVHGQNTSFSVNAIVVDTFGVLLPGASAELVSSSDSSLIISGISDKKGKLILQHSRSGDAQLYIRFLGFKSVTKQLSFSEKSGSVDLGVVVLLPDAFGMSEVLVDANRIALNINGDTIVYDAKAFETFENADVESLLRQLPGVEVDNQGVIRVNGEVVDNILVNGKQFFGNSPQMATQNLPAEIVDKVEVFDKSSEFSAFAGVDDGKQEKTINLKLNENIAQQYFGKAELGMGNESTYKGRLSLNRFDSKTQLSILAGLNNINERNFSMADYLRASGGHKNKLNGTVTGPAAFGGFLPGFTSASTLGKAVQGHSGINFNHDFSSKVNLNSSYFYLSNRTNNSGKISDAQILNNQTILTKKNTLARSAIHNHNLLLELNIQIDSANTLSFKTNGNLMTSDANDNSSDVINNAFSINEISRQLNVNNFNLKNNTSLSYAHRFSKAGRVLLASVQYLTQMSKDSSHIVSDQNFIGIGNLQNGLNQRQQNNGQNHYFQTEITVTESLTKNLLLRTLLQHSSNIDTNTRLTYDLIPETILVDSLSRPTFQKFTYNTAGINLSFGSAKLSFNLDLRAQHTFQRGLSESTQNISRHYFSLLPQVNLSWKLQKSGNLSFNYIMTTQQPKSDDLQPVPDFSNPTNIFVGNPNLTPEFSHSMSVNYFYYARATGISISAGLNSLLNVNSIIYTKTLDNQLNQITRPVNVGNRKSLNSRLSLSLPLDFIKSKLSLSGGLRWSDQTIVIDGSGGVATRNAFYGGLNFANMVKKNLDFNLSFNIDKSKTTYSNSDSEQNFINQQASAKLNWNIHKAINLGSEFAINLYANQSVSDQNIVALWHAYLSWAFLNRKLEVKLTAQDILNQNKGLHQAFGTNYYRISEFDTLGRYFMLSVIYYIKP